MKNNQIRLIGNPDFCFTIGLLAVVILAVWL